MIDIDPFEYTSWAFESCIQFAKHSTRSLLYTYDNNTRNGVEWLKDKYNVVWRVEFPEDDFESHKSVEELEEFILG